MSNVILFPVNNSCRKKLCNNIRLRKTAKVLIFTGIRYDQPANLELSVKKKTDTNPDLNKIL